MPKSKGKHLSKENREVIELGIRNTDSARNIARRLDVNVSTVTREVKANRTIRIPKARRGLKLSTRCSKHSVCQASATACSNCSTVFTTCKHCKTRNCILTCPDFAQYMCQTTEKWPYVCPDKCSKRGRCGYPKCSYDAGDANGAYEDRLSDSRKGICLSSDELKAVSALAIPLVKKGQSFEAIWSSHADELPICVRTMYSYQNDGCFDLANIELPAKVRRKPAKKTRKDASSRIDRTGRTYDDFEALPLEDRARVVQGDSVCGYEYNEHDTLSLHIVARGFQGYFYKRHGDAESTVKCLDAIEMACGSREAFEQCCPVLLLDRGVEFDDWEGMERSCLEPEKRRCRVFYCDPMESNQKSPAERNHQQLRRLLPKGRTDFDALTCADVAMCCCHVNSYPLPKHSGKCGFELLGGLLSQDTLDELGFVRVAPDDVVLKPYLIKHAVKQ